MIANIPNQSISDQGFRFFSYLIFKSVFWLAKKSHLGANQSPVWTPARMGTFCAGWSDLSDGSAKQENDPVGRRRKELCPSSQTESSRRNAFTCRPPNALVLVGLLPECHTPFVLRTGGIEGWMGRSILSFRLILQGNESVGKEES